MKHVLLLPLLLALALGGCRDEYPGTLSRERFVATNVALRSLDAAGRDSLRTAADSARARAAVLRKQGVTEKDLLAFVDARRNDTEELSETWREIATRLARADSTARADSVRRDSLARAARDTAASARRDTARAKAPAAPPDRARDTVPPAPGPRPRPGPRPGPPGKS